MKTKQLIPLFLLVLALFSCKSLHKKKSNSAAVEVSEELKEIYYQAEAEFAADHLNEAKVLFEKYVKQSPLPAAGFYRLACIEKRAGHIDAAGSWIYKAQQADTANYHYNLFEAALHQGRRDFLKAGIIYYELAQRHPDHWSFFTDGAKILTNARNYELLVSHCNNWEKAFGLKEDIVTNRCMAYHQLKQYDNAVSDWQRMATKYPYRREYNLQLAAALSNANRPTEAIAIYQQMLAADPENAELLSALCDYYSTSGDRKQLWKHVQVVANSRQMDVWKKHNCLLPFLNNLNGNNYYDSLEPVLKTLTQMHTQDHRSWLFLADWYFARKNYLPAIDGFGRSLQLFNNDYQVWSKYTECLDRTAQYSKLSKVADSMLELFPSNPTIYLIAASAKTGMGDYAKAQTAIEEGLAFAVDENITIALKLSLAHNLNLWGKKSEAYAALKVLQTAYPKNPDIMNQLARIYALNNENTESAVSLINEALQLAPNKPDYLYTKGLLMMQQQDLKQAIEILQTAANEDANGRTLELLGDAYLKSGNKKLAIEQWQKAYDLGYRTPAIGAKLATI